MSTFDSEELVMFRREYIDDLVIPPDEAAVPPVEGEYLSDYNKTTGNQFFTDATLDNIRERIEVDKALQLEGVYDTKYAEVLRSSSSTELAEQRADVSRMEALHRLIRAECREMMMGSRKFIAAHTDVDTRRDLFKAWERQNEADRYFEMQRSGNFGSTPLMRL